MPWRALPDIPKSSRCRKFYGCSAGLGSRDIRAGDFISVTENMTQPESRGSYFTLGIKHETALPVPFDPDVRSPGSFSMRGHSVGGYGSVTTNKVIATIAGEVFGMDVQAYPKYGSEKKGLPTTYYLTIAKDHIRVHSELEHVEFIPLNDVNAFNLENPLAGLTQNGMVFVQSQKTDPAEVWAAVPAWAQKELVAKNARLLALDTVAIAREVSSLADLQQRMQGIVLLGVFLKVTPFQKEHAISEEVLFKGVEKSLRKYFGKRGEQVVQDNLKAVHRGFHEVFEIPREVMLALRRRGQTELTEGLQEQWKKPKLHSNSYKKISGSTSWILPISTIVSSAPTTRALRKKDWKRTIRSRAASFPAEPEHCAISATSRPIFRCSLPKTASAAWNASRSVRTPRSWARLSSLPFSISSSSQIGDEAERKLMADQWGVTTKYFTVLEKKGAGRRQVRNLHRSDKVQRLRGMRGCLRRS